MPNNTDNVKVHESDHAIRLHVPQKGTEGIARGGLEVGGEAGTERRHLLCTSIRWLREHRRVQWVNKLGWNPDDLDRIITSKESLNHLENKHIIGTSSRIAI